MDTKNFLVDIGHDWNKSFLVTNENTGLPVDVTSDVWKLKYDSTILTVGSGITLTGNQVDFNISAVATNTYTPDQKVEYRIVRQIPPNPTREVLRGYLVFKASEDVT